MINNCFKAIKEFHIYTSFFNKKIGLIGFLFFIIAFPVATHAQVPYPETYPETYPMESPERYPARSQAPPGHFSFELGAKYLGRGITEDGFTFGGIRYPETDAWATSTQLLAKLAVDLTSNIQIYGVGGGSTLSADEFNNYSADVLIPQENWNSLAYGGGIKLTFYPKTFHTPVKLFFDLSYLQFKTEDTIFFPPAAQEVKEKIRWQQYVGKIGFSGMYDYVETYGGVRISFVRGKDHIPTSTQTLDLDFTEDIPVGIFLGSDIYLDRGGHAALFIEASLIDENSISGGVKFRF